MEDDKSLSDYGLTSTVAKAQQPAEVVQMIKIMPMMTMVMMMTMVVIIVCNDMISMIILQGRFGISWGGRNFGVGGA